MNKISCLLLIVVLSQLNSCATLMGEKAKDEAITAMNKKAKVMGLKVGSACKYIGFIGDNSEAKAKKDGGIKFGSVTLKAGGVLKNCT